MKQRKIPMRTCVVTKEKCEKKDLVRIVRTPLKIVEIDLTGKKNGRGVYLKKDLAVINIAEKNKILEKILEIEVPENIYEDLRKIIE